MNTALPDEAGFPLGSGARHTLSVPFARALGLQWLGLHAASGGTRVARLRLPFSPAVCHPDGAIDVRALVAALDHSGAPACYGARLATAATATLDLRVDTVAPLQPGQDVVIDAQGVAGDGSTALVNADARHPDGTLVARMTGRYAVGLGPGRANDSSEAPELRAVRAARYADAAAPPAALYLGLLGLLPESPWWGPNAEAPVPARRCTLGFEPWLVGSVALPALHGGVVASGLITAAWLAAPEVAALQLRSVTLQFLRAAGAHATQFEGQLVKAGARAVHVHALALQGSRSRPVASAQVLLA